MIQSLPLTLGHLHSAHSDFLEADIHRSGQLDAHKMMDWCRHRGPGGVYLQELQV